MLPPLPCFHAPHHTTIMTYHRVLMCFLFCLIKIDQGFILWQMAPSIDFGRTYPAVPRTLLPLKWILGMWKLIMTIFSRFEIALFVRDIRWSPIWLIFSESFRNMRAAPRIDLPPTPRSLGMLSSHRHFIFSINDHGLSCFFAVFCDWSSYFSEIHQNISDKRSHSTLALQSELLVS